MANRVSPIHPGFVAVTERRGRHRFSYIESPLGSDIFPSTICTDTLSHILVVDNKTNTIQMLSEDTHFLTH